MANEDQINVKVVVDATLAQSGASSSAKAVQGASDAMDSALKKVTASAKATSSAVRGGFSDMETQFRRGARAARSTASSMGASSAQINAAFRSMGRNADFAAGRMEGLGRSSTGVRRELLVLAHEIATGNWTRFGGSLMVLGERMDILAGLTGPVGLGIGAIVVAIGALVVAAYKGEHQLQQLNDSLVLTGDRAGLTSGRYLEMAQAIAKANSLITAGEARTALSATAKTGAFGPGAVQAVATAVAEISRLSGQTADKVAEDFAKMDEGVYKWANTNKEAKNLITEADAEYARTLEQQGRQEEAEVFMASRVSEALKKIQGDLGDTIGFWGRLAQVASEAGSAMEAAGRVLVGTTTNEEKIATLKMRRAEATGPGSENLNQANVKSYTDSLDAQIAALQKQVDLKNNIASQDAKIAANNAANKSGAEALDKLNERYDKEAQKLHERTDATDAYKKALQGLPPIQQRTAAQTAYATRIQSEYDATIKGINEKGPKAKTLGVGGASAVGRAEDTGELALLKDRLNFEEQALAKSYKANEITLAQYYERRKAIVKQGMDAEIAVAQRGVTNAETAADRAKGPNEQATAQASIIRAKNQVALLNQKLVEQESILTDEMQQQSRAQSNKIQEIGIGANEKQALAGVQRQQTLAQAEVALGRKTKEDLLTQEMQYEDQRYQIERTALEQRAALEDQGPVQLAQLHAQLEALESSHQQKMLTLAEQEAEQQAQLGKQIAGDMENDFAQAFGAIVSKTKTVKSAFEALIPEFEKQLGGQVTKSLTGGLFEGIGGQLKTGINAVFGNGLFGGGAGILGGGAGSTIAAQTISAATTASSTTANATVASMSVGTMLVANSTGGGGSGSSPLGGLTSMLGGLGGSSDFAGAFGFTATGVTGSAGAVASGAMAEGGTTGMSALMGIAAFAKGTNYVPSTGLALLHQGEAVIPASQNSPYNPASSNMQINNQFVLPNNVDLRTQNQISAMAGQSIQRALQRNT